MPEAIIIPGEGEQEMEKRVSWVERGAEVGRRPDRRQTDGGGPWAAETGHRILDPRPGMEPVPPALQSGFLTTGPAGTDIKKCVSAQYETIHCRH